MKEYKKRTCCAICDNTELKTVIDFGKIPLAGSFPSKDELANEKQYKMKLQFCPKCYLVQTDSIIHSDTLFKDYRYRSSIGLSKHFKEVASYLKDNFKLNEKSSVLECASNDGPLLEALKDLEVSALGIDPATNIVKISQDKGHNVINDYFNLKNAKKYFKPEQFDIIFMANSFAHIDDIHSIVQGVQYCLKENGSFVVEVHYIKNLIDQLQYDNIYHEHLYYYSLNSLKNLFRQYNMSIVEYHQLPIHAGSIRVVVQHSDSVDWNKNYGDEYEKRHQLNEKIALEKCEGLNDFSYYEKYFNKVNFHISTIQTNLKELKKQKKKIVGYGASGRANMLCNLAELDSKTISYIVDESPERNGRHIAGKHIPIVDKDFLLNDKTKPDYILIFAWNFSKMIMDKLKEHNYKFIIAFPEWKIVENSSEDSTFSL
jgi:SAM-dependent methyltransferase